MGRQVIASAYSNLFSKSGRRRIGWQWLQPLPIRAGMLLLAWALPTVAQEAESVDLDRGPIFYVDVPVLLQPGVDPVLPLPPMPAAEGPADDADPQTLERASNIRLYSGAVREIEQSGGVWDKLLVEELVALGRLQQQQGDHGAAVASFDRALHVNRINSGLHTLEQVPVVEAMIESYRALGDWDAVDLYQEYLFFVHRRAFGPDDPRLIPVLQRLGEWNLNAFTLGFGSLGLRLSSAQILYSSAFRLLSMHFGPEDERIVPMLRDIARSAYLVARYPEFLSDANGPEFRASQDALKSRLNARNFNASPRGYQFGKEALAAIVQYYRQSGQVEQEVAALADLADWELMFDRRQLAHDMYAQAWELLAPLENAEELKAAMFGQVTPIPTFLSDATNLRLGGSEVVGRRNLRWDVADVSLDVTEYGAARNIEVITEENAENMRQLARIKREVRESTFRPLVIDGQLQAAEGQQFRFRYWF